MRQAGPTEFFQAIADKEPWIAGAALVAVNVFGLAALFSDTNPGEPVWLRIGTIMALYAAGGAAVGVLLAKRWPLAVLGCGSSTLMGALALSIKLRTDDFPPYWAFIALILAGPPVVTLASGYLGSRLRQRLQAPALNA